MATDIRTWLNEIGLQEYIDAFVDAELTFDQLPYLTEADIEKLGVSKLGHRKTILRSIEQHLSTAKMASASPADRSSQLDQPPQNEFPHHGDVTDAELRKILDEHQLWLDSDGAEGKRGDLSGLVELAGGRLARENLAGVILPSSIDAFPELAHVDKSVAIARPIYLLLLLVCFYTMIIIFSADDVGLVINSKMALIPDAPVGVSIVNFYKLFPVILFIFYIYMHLYLYRLFQIIGNLPSVFSDGTPLDQSISPWLATAFVRFFQKHGVSKPSMLGIAQKWVTIALVWGIVPATIVLAWLRYLVRHDWAGTMLHSVLISLILWSAIILYRFATAGICRRPRPFQGVSGLASSGALLMGIGVVFVLLSYAAFEGSGDRFSRTRPNTWVGEVLSIANLSTSPDLTGKNLVGVDLSNKDLRGARLVEVVFSDANLSQTDLRRSDLSGAILRDADLSHSNIEGSTLWKAKIQDANFANSNLTRVLMDQAAGGRVDFKNATLTNVKLSGAVLYELDFSNATLINADLSEAKLGRATFLNADLSGSDLSLANLEHVNLFGANLKGSDLGGTILNGANLSRTTGLDQQQLDVACGSGIKGMPDGLKISPCP